MKIETSIECLTYCKEQLTLERGSDFSGVKALEMAIKALEDITIISKALSNITQWECCDYGYPEACKIADKYAESEENENGNN